MTRLSDVNTTNILDAIELASNAMCSMFDPTDGTPYFRVAVKPDAYLGMPLESHVPGRHLNALLNAEDVAGIKIDEESVSKHETATYLSYSGPLALPLERGNDGEYDTPTIFVPHHIREGFHALTALVKYRGSSRAQEIAEASIDTIFKYWVPQRDWDYKAIDKTGVVSTKESSYISGVARTIGPLVKYYRVTGYGPALALALILKEEAIGDYYTQHGGNDQDRFGTHAHSITCTMSSLAQLADLTSDSSLMDRVKAFYDNGLWDMRDEVGWSRESSALDSNKPDEGEMNNTGDIIETALILGRWGYTEYFHDAERMLRCHLLPSQLRDISWIETPNNPEELDTLHNVARRVQGSWGFPAPFGHEPLEQKWMRFNTDVVGGTVGSLCEVLREGVRTDTAGHWVNLRFDHETANLVVQSPYTNPALTIVLKQPGPLFVRIPPWVNLDSLVIKGTEEYPIRSNGYLFFATPPVNQPITLAFEMPLEELTMGHLTRDIQVRFRGDTVDAMENHGANLTFFDSI